MPTKYFEVLENFDPKKHSKINAAPSILKCLKLFKKGDIISPKKFAESNSQYLNKRSTKLNATLYTVDRSIKIAKELGLITIFDERPISYADFCNLDSVQYFLNQLRGSKLKNLKSDGMKENTTKRSYVQQIYRFNNWLHGKSFEFSTTKQIEIDVFKKTKEKSTLDGIEHLLQLFQNSFNTDSEYIKVVKMYLMDQMHEKCSAKYMSVKHSAITSYFDKNDSPLKFKYNPYNNHADYKEENENAIITLDEVYKMVTQGKASPLEKAVVLCRFHRGLDSSTLADRFNFQAWEQLVKWFGHTDFENWDLQKCPVPIRISRVKTNYLHTGYLEHDAIVAIQEYLNYRYQFYVTMCKKQKIDEGYILEKNQFIQNGKPLFVSRKNKPISVNWVSRLVPRLAVQAGIQNNLEGNRLQNKSEKVGHELRDLLKSTLIMSGCQDYVCQLAIGHTVLDSYEKQDKLYPEHSRKEYSKASNKINIFTNASNFVNNGNESEELKDKLVIIESRFNQKLEESKREQMQMIKAGWQDAIEKFYDGRISEINKNTFRNQKELDQQWNELEVQDAKHQKEKEVLIELGKVAKESGKSLIEVMGDLLKTSTIKQKQ